MFAFIGANLRLARRREQLTQEQLAERAGIDVTYVQAIERGATNFTLSVLCDLAEALKTEPGRMFQEVFPEPRLPGRPPFAKAARGEVFRRAILVVDDDDTNRSVFCRVLARAGWTAVSCQNGREALEQLESGEPPAVILLDQLMPVMNGEELLGALRARPSLAAIPVVRMSGHPWPGTEDSLFLAKPFGAEALLAAVVTAVGVGREPVPAG